MLGDELAVSEIRIGMLVAKHFCGGSQVGVVTRVNQTRCQISSVAVGDADDRVIAFSRSRSSGSGVYGLTPAQVESSDYWSRIIDAEKLKRAGWTVRS